MSLLTEYPIWFLLFCLLAGAFFSFVLYYRKNIRGEFKPSLGVMMLLRFLSVSLITFLLLTPLIRRTTRLTEKPVIAIGVDGSLSVVSSVDSAMVRKNLAGGIAKLSTELSEKFEIAPYTFGQEVSPGLKQDFLGKHTDISEFFNELASRYVNRNLGAVIIATDGIYNKGTNPAYAALKLGVPVYSVLLGDTSLHKDALISNINVSKQIYLDDQVPFEIMAQLDKYQGREVKLSVKHSGRVVFTKNLVAYNEHCLIRVSGTLDAREKGMQRYSVELESADEEFNKANNKRDFYIEVLESRIRVALVYESPHPDIAAIVSALGSSSRFELSQVKAADLKKSGKEYDLYIFYQLPSVTALTDIQKCLPDDSPALFIIGSQTDIAGFNRLKTGLVINSRQKSMTDIQPVLNTEFSLFNFEKESATVIADFPPLQCMSGAFETAALMDVLLWQKIGSVSTRYPLVMFFNMPSRKVGIIAGENFWRWRISDYMQKSDFRLFDDMMTRIAQYLSVKKDPSPFRVNVKSRLEEGDPLEFDAALFNPGHEMINTPEVSLQLKNEEGKTYPFVFSRTDKAYMLNAGYFPAGNYTYEASVGTSQGVYKKQGQLSITPLDIELVNLVADRDILYQISSRHEGKVILQKDIRELAKFLKSRTDLKSVIHLQRKYDELAMKWWMFALIIILLTAEWAIRKRNGI
ncbi:MAG: hypothetical protein WCI48_11425 [Bacteroidota bacterium]